MTAEPGSDESKIAGFIVPQDKAVEQIPEIKKQAGLRKGGVEIVTPKKPQSPPAPVAGRIKKP